MGAPDAGGYLRQYQELASWLGLLNPAYGGGYGMQKYLHDYGSTPTVTGIQQQILRNLQKNQAAAPAAPPAPTPAPVYGGIQPASFAPTPGLGASLPGVGNDTAAAMWAAHRPQGILNQASFGMPKPAYLPTPGILNGYQR